MKNEITIGIIGDFNPDNPFHQATNAVIETAARLKSIPLNFEWIPTESLESFDKESLLKSFQGFWCAPSSPYVSFEGALNAVRLARESGWPFIGT